METLYQILAFIGAGLILFFLYRTIKARPAQFSKENMSKSFYTMGLLALALMAFVFLLIMTLRA